MKVVTVSKLRAQTAEVDNSVAGQTTETGPIHMPRQCIKGAVAGKLTETGRSPSLLRKACNRRGQHSLLTRVVY